MLKLDIFNKEIQSSEQRFDSVNILTSGDSISVSGYLPSNYLFGDITAPINITQANNAETQTVDIVSDQVQLTRGDCCVLYNPLEDNVGVSNPYNTEWNEDGWADISDLSTRTYTDLDQIGGGGNFGNAVIGTELIMHDTSTDKYHKVLFSAWQKNAGNNPNYRGFSYARIELGYKQEVSGVVNFTTRPTVNGSGILLNGEAYPSNNPSGYITGVDTSNFYTKDNPSGFINQMQYPTQGGDVQIGDQGWANIPADGTLYDVLGQINDNFYPSNNPSGYITNANVVYTTGDQTISGVKTFVDNTAFLSGINIGSNEQTVSPVIKMYDAPNNNYGELTWEDNILTFRNYPDGGGNQGGNAQLTFNFQAIESDGIRTIAVDERVVHNFGDETISGIKTFTSRPTVNGVSVLLSGEAALQFIDSITLDFIPDYQANWQIDGTYIRSSGGTNTFLRKPDGSPYGQTNRIEYTGHSYWSGQTGWVIYFEDYGPDPFINDYSFVNFSKTFDGPWIPRPGDEAESTTTVDKTWRVESYDGATYVKSSETGNFYDKSNPSGFITSRNVVFTTDNQTISGVKTFASRPTVNGTGVLLSGEAASLPTTIVYTTGNQTISGIKTFVTRPTVNSSGIALSADISKIIDKFSPSQNQPPSTGFARFDTRNSILVLDFNDTTNDSGTFVGSIPDTANISNGLNVRINWSATTGTSGNCIWGARFANLSGNLDTISFGTAGFGTGTANSTNGVPTVTQITCTEIGTLTTGSFYRMLVFRNSTDTVNDTLLNDAEINFIEVRSV